MVPQGLRFATRCGALPSALIELLWVVGSSAFSPGWVAPRICRPGLEV